MSQHTHLRHNNSRWMTCGECSRSGIAARNSLGGSCTQLFIFGTFIHITSYYFIFIIYQLLVTLHLMRADSVRMCALWPEGVGLGVRDLERRTFEARWSIGDSYGEDGYLRKAMQQQPSVMFLQRFSGSYNDTVDDITAIAVWFSDQRIESRWCRECFT